MGSEVLLDIWPAVKKLKVITMFKHNNVTSLNIVKVIVKTTVTQNDNIVTKDNNVVRQPNVLKVLKKKVPLSPGTPDHKKS